MLFLIVSLLVIAALGAVGKGIVKVPKKNKLGRRDQSGNQYKNREVREKNKQQSRNPDPNARR